MPRPLKFRERKRRYPPVLIRLFAPALSDMEIAERGRLPLAEVKRLCYSWSWRGITDEITDAFLVGCGIDLEDREKFRRMEYMRRTGRFRKAFSSENRGQFEDMMTRWEDSA